MKCVDCRLRITTADSRRMVAEYSQDDGTTVLFGHEMPAGPMSDATGRLLQGWHLRCFHARRRREARGDAVTGRVLGGPSGYTVTVTAEDVLALGLTPEQASQWTVELAARLAQLRQVARSIGKGVGDSTVLEVFRAQEHGGPYLHTHHLPLDTYQLLAHLEWAHGAAFEPGGPTARQRHDALHAQMPTDARTLDTVPS